MASALRISGTYVLCALLLLDLGACGGNGTPPPETIVAGRVTIETDPLRLVLDAPSGTFASSAFIEVGVASAFSSGTYYDPRDPGGGGVTWHTATRGTKWDEDTQTLTLDNAVTLRVQGHDASNTETLVLDTSAVENPVLVRLVLPRTEGEPVFGFGEDFAAAEASGSVREMQFRLDLDSESGLNETHVPVPVSLWPARGVGVFVEDPRPGAFDIGAARADKVLATFAVSSPGPLSAHLFTADEPLALLRTYATLSGRPAVPPKWAFAPQQWRNEHDSSQQVRDDAQRMRQLGIPTGVMWIDNPWQTAYNDFRFDETRFDAPATLLGDLDALGYRVLLWSTPYVNKDGPTADDFSDARSKQYLVGNERGAPFVFPWQDGPGGLVDFSRPGATAWWRERIKRVTDMGVSGFKLDFGEDVVPDFFGQLAPLTLAGGDPQVMHARYPALYHEAYLGALPDGDGFLITRAGAYGDQTVNTCIWPGDLDNDFSLHGVDNGAGEINVGGLPAAIASMLSLSVSGYPFFGSDIGGFRNGVPTTEVLIRWTQYAALGTIMQLGGGGQSHNPWDTSLFAAPALEVYVRYARLHMDLVPYLYTLARIAGADGTPVTRPTRFVVPDAASDDATFLLGDAIFVAPVIEAGATTRDVVLPPGRWVDWWTGSAIDGDGAQSVTAAAPLETLPLWRRVDRFVPMFARAADTLIAATDSSVASYADRAYGRELRLLITPDGGDAQVAVYDGAAATGATDGAAYAMTATAGDEFDIVTFDLDARGSSVGAVTSPAAVTFDQAALPAAADEAELMTCAAPGCWLAESGRVRVRVHLVDASSHAVRVDPS